ncbi:BTB/POZ protein [Rhizophagus diaphanus]|nr:BTB/POZ protein [Rhizophagus diaphanus] [Rhizophagus sp. MUCL 43196]
MAFPSLIAWKNACWPYLLRLRKLFETETGYDVIIYAGEEQNIKEIHAHSNILCARSQYFRTAFSNEWTEKRDGKFIFRKSNISPQLLNIILRFIYCGNIELKNLQGSEVLKLLIAVNELNINSLVCHIQEFLIEHQTEFLQQNPIGILEIVYQYETFTDLWNFSSLLELLLKRDDLNIDEIEIWEYLLKWCFAQQNMQNDPTKWNKDNIIRSNHIHLFASWIDKKDSSHYKKNVPYYFKLLYRSSQDGVDTKSFHKNFSYVKKQDRAVWSSFNHGPTMGNLYNYNNNWSNIERGHGDSYPNIGIPKYFEVEDYEVFQVIEK